MFVWSYFQRHIVGAAERGLGLVQRGRRARAAESRTAARNRPRSIPARRCSKWPTSLGPTARCGWRRGLTSTTARRRWKHSIGPTSAYQSILQSSDDERLQNRAHFGLARVYEMQNELDKAREEYLARSRAAYAEYAKEQAERLEKPEAKDTYAWLATAEAAAAHVADGPRHAGPAPGVFPGDCRLPGATGATRHEPAAAADDIDRRLACKGDRRGTGSDTDDPKRHRHALRCRDSEALPTESARPADADRRNAPPTGRTSGREARSNVARLTIRSLTSDL